MNEKKTSGLFTRFVYLVNEINDSYYELSPRARSILVKVGFTKTDLNTMNKLKEKIIRFVAVCSDEYVESTENKETEVKEQMKLI